MYRNTTLWQVGRAVGVWVFGLGLLVVPFLVTQARELTDPQGAAAAAAWVAGGTLLYFGSLGGLRRADAHNRPLLLAPEGYRLLTGRKEFEDLVARARNWLLLLTVASGALFVFVIGIHSCGDEWEGICSIERWSYDATLALQSVTLGLGTAFVAAAVLHSIHAKESERLGQLISEGRKMRRQADPFAGVGGSGWDFE